MIQSGKTLPLASLLASRTVSLFPTDRFARGAKVSQSVSNFRHASLIPIPTIVLRRTATRYGHSSAFWTKLDRGSQSGILTSGKSKPIAGLYRPTRALSVPPSLHYVTEIWTGPLAAAASELCICRTIRAKLAQLLSHAGQKNHSLPRRHRWTRR